MAENPQRINKSLMNSPYFSGFTQGKQGNQPANRPNMSTVRQGGMSVRGGQQAMPKQSQIYGRPVYADRSAARAQAKYQKFNKPEYDAYSKQKRRERDYFFVMRKGTCFFMFILSAVIIAIIALGFVGVPSLDNYTALFVEPDNTLAEERGEGYQDTSSYISFADPIYGFIDKITGKEITEDYPYTFRANADAIAAGVEANPEDSMGAIASMVYQYFPVVIILIAIFALVILIISFGGMLGKRIFKGYGALALVMLIMSIVVALAGLAVLGVKSGNPQIGEDGTLVSVLDFSKILPFISRIFTGAPAAAVDGETAVTPAAYAAGYGLLGLIILPLLIMVISLFARRKVPYSVFDR